LSADELLVYRYFTRVVAVSEDLASQLILRGIKEDKIVLIQNGFDPDLLHVGSSDTKSEALPITSENTRVFSVVGRLYPDKGHRFFLEAFAQIARSHPDVCAWLVGDGPAREEIRQYVQYLGLFKHVKMLGVCSNMQQIYERSDFIVIPSLREGLPYVLFEALHQRVPILATNVGDIPKVIIDGNTGRIVPPGNVSALHSRMTEMLLEEESNRRMAEQGYRVVCDRFSKHRMLNGVQKLYEMLVEQ
jgi:glycosyltransferase involved in cell wall biosynthesis